MLFLALSLQVVRLRYRYQVALGAPHRLVERAVRAHGNCAEYVPFGLLLLGLLEGMGLPAWGVHALGSALLAGRALHAWGISREPEVLRFRTAGMALTFTVFGVAARRCSASSWRMRWARLAAPHQGGRHHADHREGVVAAANAAVPRISPAEAKALHAKGEAVFIDLREPPELAASGTVPGALPIPRGLLEFRADPESPTATRPFEAGRHHLLRLRRPRRAGRQAAAGARLQGRPQPRRLQGLGRGRRRGGEGLRGGGASAPGPRISPRRRRAPGPLRPA